MYFTDEIANYIQENELQLNNLTIILPSERAKKYIKSSLFKVYQKPIFSPKMITIDQWIRELSDKPIIDKTRLLIKLFEVQLDKAEKNIDYSFDEFLAWGNLLLSDFDELDRYLLDSKQLFKNLADIKEIENWSFGQEQLSDGQKRFMEFWDRLPGYYDELNKKLNQEQVRYMGKVYRFVAENIDVVFQSNKDQHFIFAGFNALSPAEISIMKQLQRLGRGHILINADEYYLNSDSHEAGMFLRDFQSKLEIKKLPFVQNKLTTDTKNIEVIECVQHTGQVKVAGTILNKMTKDEIDSTLLLLADESLIAPLVKNLPKNIGKANITLGLPLKNTSLRSWIDLLFSIQENKKHFKTNSAYFQDVQKIWNHPFLTAILNEDEKSIIIQKELEIVKRNTIFLSIQKIDISAKINELLQLIFVNWDENWELAITTIRQLNSFLFNQLNEKDEFEKAILENFDASLVDFENIIIEGIPAMNISSFKKLFHHHWGQKSIAYHGNPIEGLQIMGLLETRLLDFEHIICLGLNEGKMPPTNAIQTMIPMDLRRFFGLPTTREKQGLFAHHFYRLLHNCKNLYVTYTTAQEMIGSNEQSRYLMQIELELCRLNPNVKLNKSHYSLQAEDTKTNSKIAIEKSEDIIKRLDEMFEKSTSASLLKTFVLCPLDFYYKNVLEFGEEEKVEEEVENNTFGTFIHTTLENLYQPFSRFDKQGNLRSPAPKNITSFDIDEMLKHYEEEITNEFLKHFNNDKESFTKGKNLLSFKMAKELTKRFLLKEKEFLMQQSEPVFIESLEREFIHELDLEIFGEVKKIRLKGIVDRIDSIGDKIRIIDYKSGVVKEDDTKIPSRTKSGEEVDFLKHIFEKKYTLQLLMYSYLYQKQFGVIPDQVGIYSFIKINDGLFQFNPGLLSVEEITDRFPQLLTQFIEKIYDLAEKFEHNPKANYCIYC